MPTKYYEGRVDAVTQISAGSIDSVDAMPVNSTTVTEAS